MLSISKLKRWSINYYNDTAMAAGHAAKDVQRANGGLGEYYSETRPARRSGFWPATKWSLPGWWG